MQIPLEPPKWTRGTYNRPRPYAVPALFANTNSEKSDGVRSLSHTIIRGSHFSENGEGRDFSIFNATKSKHPQKQCARLKTDNALSLAHNSTRVALFRKGRGTGFLDIQILYYKIETPTPKLCASCDRLAVGFVPVPVYRLHLQL